MIAASNASFGLYVRCFVLKLQRLKVKKLSKLGQISKYVSQGSEVGGGTTGQRSIVRTHPSLSFPLAFPSLHFLPLHFLPVYLHIIQDAINIHDSASPVNGCRFLRRRCGALHICASTGQVEIMSYQ